MLCYIIIIGLLVLGAIWLYGYVATIYYMQYFSTYIVHDTTYTDNYLLHTVIIVLLIIIYRIQEYTVVVAARSTAVAQQLLHGQLQSTVHVYCPVPSQFFMFFTNRNQLNIHSCFIPLFLQCVLLSSKMRPRSIFIGLEKAHIYNYF